MHSRHLFNDQWLFLPQNTSEDTADSQFESVTLPHSNRILPYHNFDDAEYQFVSTYRKTFRLPEPLNGRRLFLDFDGAMIAATVTLNGQTFPEHRGGYVPFSFDISDAVRETGENRLIVRLDSTERKDIPPFGYVVDYLTFGGIYRDVHLRYVAPCFIDHIFVRTADVLSESPKVTVDMRLKNQSSQDFSGEIRVWSETGESAAKVTVPAQGEAVFTLDFAASEAEPWTLDQPRLYSLKASLHGESGRVDEQIVRFGFREARFREDGFYLNGERLQLRGLNRHQTYPYIGAAAPARLQRKDADIVKFELGCNIVRTSHYPQSPYFLDRCDEIGLLVFEEIPGWQFIGDEDWKALSLRDVRVMIERDCNHPSIILWGVRINESWDDEAFYTATNQLAREIDPTRQTGGVRFFQNSQFLEDVFTFNDFSNSIAEPEQTPHLVTEFNGHMFPTKSFDNEDRRLEHALRHARIQSKAANTGGVSGAIGWCAFDYNTHKEFGSGDRICYHGVMDIFRLPKLAAHFYASQISPEIRPIVQAATMWTMGDRSGGGNDPLTVFSNCDRIEIFAGAERIGEFLPDHAHFPNLPHPPFTVTGLGMRWGQDFGDLKVIGYYQGKVAGVHEIVCDPREQQLLLKVDDAQLDADGADMTRLIFKVADRHGNPLPYAINIVNFEIEGPADLIGDNPFPLVGGQAALYIRARHESGQVTIRASARRLPAAEVSLIIR